MIEGIASPCVFQAFAHPTSPPACAVRQSGSYRVYFKQSRERLSGQIFGRRRGVLSVLTLIYVYSLVGTLCFTVLDKYEIIKSNKFDGLYTDK